MNKNFLAVLLLLTGAANAQLKNLTIKEAAQQKIIQYKIYGSYNRLSKHQYIDADGQYYGKCMTIEIRSLISDTLELDMENGQMLMAQDTLFQDMVVTKYAWLTLYPKQSKSMELYAMCSEIKDGPPDSRISYKIGNLAGKDLVLITNVIEETFMQNVVGQGAVWAYTDQATSDQLYQYGADANTFEKTIEILNHAGVQTKLNPAPMEIAPVGNEPAVAEPVAENKISEPDDTNLISLSIGVFYTGIGLLVICLIVIIILVIRRTKRDSTK